MLSINIYLAAAQLNKLKKQRKFIGLPIPISGLGIGSKVTKFRNPKSSSGLYFFSP
jgi:hypothetical protein